MKTKKPDAIIEIVKVGEKWFRFIVRSPNGRIFNHQYNAKRGAFAGARAMLKALRGKVEIRGEKP